MANSTVWIYASIPIICALIGWGTNWRAIHMTFYPLEFVGVGNKLGWQGVIPRNSKRIAGKTVGLITSRLIRPQEVLAKLDSQEIIRETTARNIETWLNEGHFWRGSMEPKIKAALYFLQHHGKEVIITSIDNIMQAIQKKAGTRIRNN